MNPLIGPVAALAVASLYYFYRHYLDVMRQRDQRIRERVTYMLWVAANGSCD